MSVPHKRSVSPFSLREDEEPAKKSRFGFSGIFSFLKQKQVKVSGIFGDNNNENKELQIVKNEPLMNNFSSLKKRRVSLQTHEKNGFVPRSSTLGNSIGRYQSFYNNLKTEKEERNNDLERRLSTAFDIVSKNPKVWEESTRDDSPIVDLVTQEAMIQKIENEDDEEESPTSDSVDSHFDYQLIIEHEFAPLYKDSEGNLVRPPFINLDPRERYHLLQLKKSIEASESLQRRIKYMIDPNETISKKVPNTNKVETSTQTNNFVILETTTRFASKRKLQDRKYLKNTKRSKNNQGFFVGEFMYKIENEPKEKVSKEYKGYLGNIKKPDFSAKTGISENRNLGTQINETQDQSSDININKFAKSTSSRPGLNESLLNNSKVIVSLDDDYVKSTKKVENIIKLKDGLLKKDDEKKSSDVHPSTGFQFSINKENINNIVAKRKENHDEISLQDQKKKRSIDDDDDTTTFKSTPTFSFGKSTESKLQVSDNNKSDDKLLKVQFGSLPLSNLLSKDSEVDEKQPSKFAFNPPSKNVSSKVDNQVPLFSLNNTDSLSKNENKVESSKPPLFSFGGNKTDSKPSISFGTDTKTASDKLPKPIFSFGNKTSEEDKAKSTIIPSDNNTTEENSKTTFTFSNNNSTEGEKTKQVFNPSNNKVHSEEKPKSTFSFSKETKPETSSESSLINPTKSTFSFDKPKTQISEKPAFSFGSSNDKTKPAFIFGKKSTEDGKKVEETNTTTQKPSLFSNTSDNSISNNDSSSLFNTNSEVKKPAPFTFGGSNISSTESKDVTPNPVSTPTFSFSDSKISNEKKESTESSAPTFTFGGSKPSEEVKNKTPPAFSFGNSKSLTSTENSKSITPAPAFTFGNVTASDTQKSTTPAPAFSFGNVASTASLSQTNVSKPAFTFGKTASTESPKVPASSAFGGSSASTSKPAFGFANNSKEATPNSNATPQPAFSFGASSQIGTVVPNASGSSTPTSKFNFGQTSTTFGAANSTPNVGTANPFPGFGSRPGSALNNPRSNESTPQPFSFNPQSAPSSSSVPAINTMNGFNSMPSMNTAPTFNFTGNASKEGTPDPASIFGGANSASRENTPFGGAPMNGTPLGTAPPNPTPIVRTGRKIAQMRQRRR